MTQQYHKICTFTSLNGIFPTATSYSTDSEIQFKSRHNQVDTDNNIHNCHYYEGSDTRIAEFGQSGEIL